MEEIIIINSQTEETTTIEVVEVVVGGRGRPICKSIVSLVTWLLIVIFGLTTTLPPIQPIIHSKESMLETPQVMLQVLK